MKSQVCFNTDKVTVIYLTKETPSTYKFYPAEPRRQKYICRWLSNIYPFSAIPFGKTSEEPDRWAQGNPKYSYEPHEDMIKDERFKVVGEGNDKTLIVKAKLVVYLGHNEYVRIFCDSNEEAESIVNTTKNLTMNPIQTILLD